MTAAIATAIAARDNDHRLALEAREFVRPIVGNVSLALDSAEAIYRQALTMRGVAVNGIHPDAYRPILENLAKTNTSQARELALDTAAARGFNDRFPEVARVRVQA